MKSKRKLSNNRLFHKLLRFIGTASDNHIPAYSAQSSFFIVISMVPFTMLFFSIFRLFIPLDQTVLVTFIEDYFPQSIKEFGLQITSELYSSVSFSVVSITTLALLWSASKGVKSIVTGLKNIYGNTRPTDFIFNIVFSLIFTVAFIVVMAITIIVLIFGRRLNELIFSEFPLIEKLISELLGFRNILFLLPLVLFFAASYKLLAKNDLPFKKHFSGAVFTAVGWMLFSYFYSLYIDNFANYSYIYGSLTAIILLMLWLYFCMMIFLVGAQINLLLFERNISIKSAFRAAIHKIKNKRRDKNT